MQYKKEAWARNNIIGFMLILSAITVIGVSIDNSDLYWLLILTSPLLSLGIYIFWKANRLGYQYYIDRTKAVLPRTRFAHSANSIYLEEIKKIDLSVLIGNDQCRLPYEGSVLNLRLVTNKQSENRAVDETETYQLAGRGLVLQVGPDCFACRTENGGFDSKAFKSICSNPQVKLIELVLPSSKNLANPRSSIFQTTETSIQNNLIFGGAEGMIHFLDSLRTMSGGKSIGIRLSIENKKDFYKICHAIQKTQFFPDFIVVEGSVIERSDLTLEQKLAPRLSLFEALQFVSRTLQQYSLEKKIKIVAAGNISSGFDILKALAIGANVVCCEIADHNISKYFPKEFLLNKNEVIHDMYESVTQITVDMMNAYGFKSVNEITIPNLFCKLNAGNLKSIEPLNDSMLYPGSVRKIYNTKIKAQQLRVQRNKKYIA